jgi:hypothetical protein
LRFRYPNIARIKPPENIGWNYAVIASAMLFGWWRKGQQAAVLLPGLPLKTTRE